MYYHTEVNMNTVEEGMIVRLGLGLEQFKRKIDALQPPVTQGCEALSSSLVLCCLCNEIHYNSHQEILMQHFMLLPCINLLVRLLAFKDVINCLRAELPGRDYKKDI